MKYPNSYCNKIISVLKFWAFFLFITCSFAQQNDLILKAQELVYSNPDEALKITKHILKTSQDDQAKAVTNLLIAKSYLVKGDFNEAMKYAFYDDNLFNKVSDKTLIELNIIRAKLLRKVYLDKQSQKYLKTATTLTKNLSYKGIEKDSLQCLIFLEQINRQINRLEDQEALLKIDSVANTYKLFLENNVTEKQSLFLAKERAYSNLAKYDSAAVYIDKTLKMIDSAQITNLYQKAIIYKELGHLFLQKKEFSKSEETLFIASKFAEIINNPILLMEINNELAINYLATNKKIQHKIYNDRFLTLNNQVKLNEQEAVNTLYNILSKQEKQLINNEKQLHNKYLYFLLASILLIVIIGVYFIIKSESRKKRLREIINYLKVSRSNYLNAKPTKKPKPKGIVIPEETEQAILVKLKKFETTKKFLNKDMSLAVLAGQFETNTKYLSGVINKHYDDNFNTFINKLRINYIIDKLQNDANYINYKISFLAEESGYSSHSSFATVFKSIVGMSPVTFIKLIQEDRKKINLKKIVNS
ncbi:helix-turn-helix domain-containing protein [Lacinutrix chionoecetis]